METSHSEWVTQRAESETQIAEIRIIRADMCLIYLKNLQNECLDMRNRLKVKITNHLNTTYVRPLL